MSAFLYVITFNLCPFSKSPGRKKQNLEQQQSLTGKKKKRNTLAKWSMILLCMIEKKDGGWEEVERGVAEFSQCVFNLEKGKIY